MQKLKKYIRKFIKKDNSVKTQLKFLNLPYLEFSDKDNFNPYLQNPIVYKCINLISTAISHVPLYILKNTDNNSYNKLRHHKALNLLKAPNPYSTGKELLFGLVTNMLLYGSSYLLIHNSRFEKLPCSIFLLDSKDIEPVYNKEKLIGYKHITHEKIYYIDQVEGCSKILHFKNYNPNNSFNGYKILETSEKTLNLYNKILDWNISLLQNTARPSGALSFKDPHTELTEEQFERLKEQFTENFAGSYNSGKPLILEGGLEWKEFDHSKVTENFLELKNSLSRDIATLFNIPSQLIGIKGDNTYSNMQEARLAFWEENIIPLLHKLSDSLSRWLSYWFNENLNIEFDIDAISSLNEKRENLWKKVSNASFMTLNEKRAIFNLPPLDQTNPLDKI